MALPLEISAKRVLIISFFVYYVYLFNLFFFLHYTCKNSFFLHLWYISVNLGDLSHTYIIFKYTYRHTQKHVLCVTYYMHRLMRVDKCSFTLPVYVCAPSMCIYYRTFYGCWRVSSVLIKFTETFSCVSVEKPINAFYLSLIGQGPSFNICQNVYGRRKRPFGRRHFSPLKSTKWKHKIHRLRQKIRNELCINISTLAIINDRYVFLSVQLDFVTQNNALLL